ncbi:ornithine carbamoyltransferase Arg3 [Schizosaccharomyces cryophilus OY26]|uniref:ornithine carbamoyltransferase n=1 Tax=Schizosaccharomyces cryophilus (strain OY26 / ATCC MYA-4695 / CBS 11777 / NBRC 106824 / NRRL Y48691) TaxID=653667 RepID=S9VVJ3_SCHCR|nr:ornithine carbamoyltransferase Arg3 [Schizosaccharomyces cryophilus OY26]EPY51808.1 ornithine carbamoyltransferase Arg3 [Schizosaccharomyces cryophilus OY26]
MSFQKFPRHLLSIRDLSREEMLKLITRSAEIKHDYKKRFANRENVQLGGLEGQNVAMIFNKRSTRTRVSVETAVNTLGGNCMFLGKDDIQLGVNESFYDTSKVISSMVAGVVARVNKYSDVANFAQHASCPVINGLCDTFHPLQALADLLTIQEAFGTFKNLKLAWIGDANNVLHDLMIACAKAGIDTTIANPKNVEIRSDILNLVRESSKETNAKHIISHDPAAAVRDADIVVTDTWISMGQEAERQARLKQFAGFQVTEKIMQLAKPHCKFMHCMPRHPEEVSDGVFYGPNSLVFQEAENRKWTTVAALEALVVNRGNI